MSLFNCQIVPSCGSRAAPAGRACVCFAELEFHVTHLFPRARAPRAHTVGPIFMQHLVAAQVCGSLQYVDNARTCSWYEHHHLGGCQRPSPRAGCTHARLRRASSSPWGSAMQRLAVLIPFRGEVSPESFEALCSHLPGHLQQQHADFHLLAVNQVDEHPFNRAALANAAFRVLTAGGRGAGLSPSDVRPFTCLAIHDIDRYPSTSNSSCAPFTRSYYSCPTFTPSVLHPESYTGGVLLLRPALYRAINGFSNEFWGWGHEDNELYLRLRACGRPPIQASQLDWCMEHRDCERCKRAKPAGGADALRAETHSIALLRGRMADPLRYAANDGVANLSFSAAPRPLALPCGQHTLHVLDVRLHRTVLGKGGERRTCTADGGARDDGCVASVAVDLLPPRLLARARRGLPPSARFRRVVSATRERAMYNFNYEIDMLADFENCKSSGAPCRVPSVVRVAVCAQEWQDRDVPDDVRYQLLWRAVASPSRRQDLAHRPAAGAKARAVRPRFRLWKNFSYHGHFPCTLRAPPPRV